MMILEFMANNKEINFRIPNMRFQTGFGNTYSDNITGCPSNLN